jgi:hypothetical protein
MQDIEIVHVISLANSGFPVYLIAVTPKKSKSHPYRHPPTETAFFQTQKSSGRA